MSDKNPSILRTAHGSAAAKLLVTERPPIDELGTATANPAANEAGTEALAGLGRVGEPGNSAASTRKTKLARVNDVPAKAHPDWPKYHRQARQYAKRRIHEMTVASGGSLGSAPCMMLARAATLWAQSACLADMAAETLDAETMLRSARLGDSARQMELTAIAVAEREAQANTESDSDRVRRERLETAARRRT